MVQGLGGRLEEEAERVFRERSLRLSGFGSLIYVELTPPSSGVQGLGV